MSGCFFLKHGVNDWKDTGRADLWSTSQWNNFYLIMQKLAA